MYVIRVLGSTELWGSLPSNLSEHRLVKGAFLVWVPQCIHNYLCVDTCALSVYLVGKIVEYVEEHHEVTGNSKTI